MQIGIIGSGAMGSGIAQVAATAGCTVFVLDSNPQALENSKKNLQNTLDQLSQKGKISPEKAAEILAHLHFSSTMNDLAGCTLVIEAIVENLEVKQTVFKNLEEAVSETCILASNTSSLSIASIAAACKNPGRVVGIHFFNPAPLMKLVEIIPAVQSEQHILEKAKSIIDGWGKTTVLAKDTPGFIVNRVARPFYGEAIRLLEEGFADAATIDWAMTELGGFKMGPFTLMDYIGHDVNFVVTETVFKAFYNDERYKPSFTQKRLLEAGYLGRKSGKGFYHYAAGATMPEANKDAVIGQRIVDRILVMLINEAADAAFLQVASKADIDLAMTLGVNYPKGLLKWADEIGIQNCVNRLDALFDEYHEPRYRCSPLLRRMARAGQSFF